MFACFKFLCTNVLPIIKIKMARLGFLNFCNYNHGTSTNNRKAMEPPPLQHSYPPALTWIHYWIFLLDHLTQILQSFSAEDRGEAASFIFSLDRKVSLELK